MYGKVWKQDGGVQTPPSQLLGCGVGGLQEAVGPVQGSTVSEARDPRRGDQDSGGRAAPVLTRPVHCSCVTHPLRSAHMEGFVRNQRKGFTQLQLSAPGAGRALTSVVSLTLAALLCRLLSGTSKERASRDPLPPVCLWWFRLSGFPGSACRRIRMP